MDLDRDIVLLFPGQGSQTPEMRDTVAQRAPDLLERCSDLVGEDPFARVEESSPAAEAGIQRGDVIREINRQRIRTPADYERITRDAKEGDRLTVLLQRGPMSLYVAFTVGRG